MDILYRPARLQILDIDPTGSRKVSISSKCLAEMLDNPMGSRQLILDNAIEQLKGESTGETQAAPDPSSIPQTPPENVTDPAKEAGPQTINYPKLKKLQDDLLENTPTYIDGIY